VGDKHVRGILLGARMRFLNAQGAIPKQRVLDSLSDADRATLTGVLLPNSWYDADLLARLDDAIAATVARGQRRELFRAMGRYSADLNLGPAGVQRPYLREGDVHFLMRHVPRMYTAVHGEGRRTYEGTGERSAVIRTLEGKEANDEDCLTTVGWLERGIELSGGLGARVVETRCRAKGDPFCEYRCEWR